MELPAVLTTVALITGCSALHYIFSLLKTYRKAKKTNFPLVLFPAHEMNPFLLVYSAFNRKIISCLPFGLSKWTYLTFFHADWAFHTRFELFQKYGECLLFTKPGSVSLFIANAEVASEVYARRQDFPKDTRLYDWVRFYGNNVLTTEGKEWQKHRRVTAPPFNAVNKAVWDETLLQAVALKNAWLFLSKTEGSFTFLKDLCTVSRNVVSAVGFGVALPFETAVPLPTGYKAPSGLDDSSSRYDQHFALHSVPDGHRMSFGKALDTLLDHVLYLVLLPKFLLKHGNSSMKTTGLAYNELGVYLQELLERERSLRGSQPGKNLLGSLLANSEAEKSSDRALTDEELQGNVFLFAVAGMETTAGTLQYIMYLLALYEESQTWFREQLKTELEGQDENPLHWDFQELFPKLVSPLCIIYETLRHYGPFQNLPKWTADKPQTLNYDGKICYLDPGTTVYVTLTGLHLNPKYWGDQTFGFHPEAWDARSPESGWTVTDSKTGQKRRIAPEKLGITRTDRAPFNKLNEPIKGSYAPFSEGVRSCLGREFAIVEMVLLLAVIFSGPYRVEIALKEDESKEDARKRVLGMLRNSSQVNTLMVRQDLELKWVLDE